MIFYNINKFLIGLIIHSYRITSLIEHYSTSSKFNFLPFCMHDIPYRDLLLLHMRPLVIQIPKRPRQRPIRKLPSRNDTRRAPNHS